MSRSFFLSTGFYLNQVNLRGEFVGVWTWRARNS